VLLDYFFLHDSNGFLLPAIALCLPFGIHLLSTIYVSVLVFKVLIFIAAFLKKYENKCSTTPFLLFFHPYLTGTSSKYTW
jgi:hypothetical protein